LARPSKPIAALGDLEGGEPGAPVRWERRHPAGLGQARRTEQARRTPEATHFAETSYRVRYTAVPGEAVLPGGGLPKRFRLAEVLSTNTPRGLDDKIMSSAYLYWIQYHI